MTIDEQLKGYEMYIKIEPNHIDFLNKVFEGYDNLAVVSTVNSKEGILVIRGYGKEAPVRRILRGLPFTVELL